IAGMYIYGTFISSGNVAVNSSWKVISATDTTVGGVPQADVVLEPNVTQTTWNTYTSNQKAAWQPTGGMLMTGPNSVSDYEQWCNNNPVNNPNNLIFFWLQTTRKSFVVSSEYLKAIQAPNMNEFFKVFNMLPYAEQLVQQTKRFYEDWWTGIFKGQ